MRIENLLNIMQEKFTGKITNEGRLRKAIEKTEVEALKRALPKFLNNEEVIKFAIENISINGCGEDALEYASPDLLDNEEIIKFAIEKCGEIAFKYASSRIQNDLGMLLYALREGKNDFRINNGLAFQLASEQLRNNRTALIAAIEKQPPFYNKQTPFYNKQLPYGIMLPDPIQEEMPFKYASDDLKNNKEISLLAVKKNPLAILYAGKDVKDDNEIMLVSLQQCGYMLEYANEEQKRNLELVSAATNNEPRAIKFADETIKDNEDILGPLIERRPGVILFASRRLQNKWEKQRHLFVKC